MRKLAAQIIIASAAPSAVFAQSPPVIDQFSGFAGWWRSESDVDACEERNLDRLVSISRSQNGKNSWQIDTPNGSCELSDLTQVIGKDGTIQADASCPAAIARHSGSAEFFHLSSGRFYVETPVFNDVLFSCDAFVPPSTQEIAASAARTQISAVAALEALTGYWRYDDAVFGCNDNDGRTRTVLGRYEFDDNWQLVRNDGPLRFGFYEGECELIDPLFIDGKLAATAICTSEGEPFDGRVTIEALGDVSIAVTSPALSDAKLTACDPDQVAGIAALPAPAATAPDITRAGSANTSEPPDAPLVVSTPLTSSAPINLPVAEATYLDPQRNALARVIADYCQPDFFEQNHWGDGQWDQDYYGRYERQLLVRYLSDCTQFMASEFVGFTGVDEMLGRRPHLFGPGAATLPPMQAMVLGYLLRLKDVEALFQCNFAGSEADFGPELEAVVTGLSERATRSDMLAVAAGYANAKSAERYLAANASNTAKPECSARTVQMSVLQADFITSGFLFQHLLPQRSSP